MTAADSIWTLYGDPWRERFRFYPPGQHPATARMRSALQRAYDIRSLALRVERDTGVPAVLGELTKCIAYLEHELAAFEGVESEAKARVAAVLRC